MFSVEIYPLNVGNFLLVKEVGFDRTHLFTYRLHKLKTVKYRTVVTIFKLTELLS